MQKSLHTIFWSLASRIITFSLILIQGIFVARLLGPEGKGLQAKLMTAIGLIVVFFDFGLSNSVNYFIGQKLLNRDNLLKVVFSIVGSQTIFVLLTLAVIIWTPLRNQVLNSENQITFVWFYLGGTAVLDLIRLSVSSVLSAHLKFSWLNRADLGAAMLRLIFYGLVFLFKNGDEGAIWFIFAADLSINLISLLSLIIVFFVKKVEISKPVDINQAFVLSTFFLYSTPILLSNILNYFNTRLDFWLIEKHLGLENLGYYAMANTGAQLLTIIPAVFGVVVFSYLNKMQEEEKRASFAVYSRISFSVVFVGVICAELLSTVFIPVLYGEKFSKSVPLFQGMLITTLVQSFRYLLGIFCQATNQNKLRLRSDLISAFVNAVSLIFVMNHYGMIGVIGVLTLSHIIGCADMLMNLKFPIKSVLSLMFFQRQDLQHFRK